MGRTIKRDRDGTADEDEPGEPSNRGGSRSRQGDSVQQEESEGATFKGV